MSSLRELFPQIITEVGLKDDKLIMLVSDISHFRFKPFFEKRPKQYYNVGICENTIVNMSTGLAALGFHVVVHTFTSFLLERSFEQIKLGFGYQKLGGNIIGIGSGVDYSCHGATHHCYGDFALMKAVDNSEIVFPVTEVEFRELFQQTYNDGKLTFFRIPQYSHDFVFNPEDIKFGKGIIIKEGKDVTIIVCGQPLKSVLNSVKELEKLDISPEIIYLHTIKPLDIVMISRSLQKTKKCLVVEEHSMYGGIFDDVLRFTRDLENIKYSFINFGGTFIHEYGTYEQHHKRFGFSSEGIIDKVMALGK